MGAADSKPSLEEAQVKLASAREEVARLEALVSSLSSEGGGREGRRAGEEEMKREEAKQQGGAKPAAGDSHSKGGGATEAASSRSAAAAHGEVLNLAAGATPTIAGVPKKAPKEGKPGVGSIYRPPNESKQEKGGYQLPGSYEETWWKPSDVMPSLGMRPVGHIRTCFPRKNGCPRQGSVVPASRARIDLTFGSNPQHGADGLKDFSHVWIVFLFDGNGTNYIPRPHITPPRLNGVRKGVFATRSPHRPNPIGLSLCRLEEVKGRTLFLSGVDLVDGTPILDVKPYIPCYDAPFANGPDGADDFGSVVTGPDGSWGNVRYPGWCVPSESTRLSVTVTEAAAAQLEEIIASGAKPRILKSWGDVKDAMRQVLQADPRSVYRKTSCVGEIYPFYLDCLDVRCVFDESNAVEVRSIALVPIEAQKQSVKAGGCSAPGVN